MRHEPAPLSGSAQHPDTGSHCFRCEHPGQHVVVVRHNHIPLRLLPVRETEEIHDERGVHHLFGLLPVPLVSQRVEKVHAMLLYESTGRSVRETGSELNAVVSSQEGDSTTTISSDLIRVRTVIDIKSST